MGESSNSLYKRFMREAEKAQKWADHYRGSSVEHVSKSSYHQGRANAFRQAANFLE